MYYTLAWLELTPIPIEYINPRPYIEHGNHVKISFIYQLVVSPIPHPTVCTSIHYIPQAVLKNSIL